MRRCLSTSPIVGGWSPTSRDTRSIPSESRTCRTMWPRTSLSRRVGPFWVLSPQSVKIRSGSPRYCRRSTGRFRRRSGSKTDGVGRRGAPPISSLLLNRQAVMHVENALHLLGVLRGQLLFGVRAHRAIQHHHAVLRRDVDVVCF